VEGDPQEQDERFAEWYVWAKREVATDNRVCLGAAQAAVEALESGADEQSARTAARGSIAGHGVVLLTRISPRRRAYAEWYDWARREVGGGRQRQHASARAALHLLDAGSDAGSAAAAARASVGPPEPSAASPWAPPANAPGPPQASVAPSSPPPTPPTAPTAPTVPEPSVVGAGPWAPPAAAPAAGAPAAGTPAFQAPPQVATPAPPYAPQYGAIAQPPAPVMVPSHVYAGFWRRAAAWLIDSVLLFIGFLVVDFVGTVFVSVGLLSSGQDLTNDNTIGPQLVLLLISFILGWLYYAGLESSSWQGTVGKRLMRIVVTDQYGRRISFGRASGRFFAKIVSAITLFVGYLMAAFTERNQALHDLMAATLVVRQEHVGALTAQPKAATPAQPGQPGQPDGAGEVQGV
jgi:uncharacterized RDD family membrane protein YckC